MPLLKDILKQLAIKQQVGDTLLDVKGICIDSRRAEKGIVFVAIKGTITDGHQYIDTAIKQGTNIIVCEQLPSNLADEVTYIVVPNTSIAVGDLAAAFYDYPSQELVVVGVTGTNGKTTVATLLYQLFSGLGYKCGLISTVQNMIGVEKESATHTTPDAVSIQSLFYRMRDAGCSHVFMEVSSHAIHQHRIQGIDFNAAVFTNITHDHLDYHKSFDEYIRVKKQLFDQLSPKAFALTNIDDKRGAVMLQNTKAHQYSYSLRVPADIKGRVLENNLSGLIMDIDGHEAHLRMIGTFNAYNLLAVYGVAKYLHQDPIEVLTVLSTLNGAPGRFETVSSSKDQILGIVDYAHTPDALLNVLATIQQLRAKEEQLITVVGCGGDRDKEKRPLMAAVAADKSDRLILTSDNPRSEDAEQILNDMEQGLGFAQKRKTLRISDRKEAIKTAVALANPGDIVLVAGKGHETYQEINGVRHHFDDCEVLKDVFNLLNR